MEHTHNLKIRSEILENQSSFIFGQAYEKLGDQATEHEVRALAEDTIQRYYQGVGRPLMIPRKAESGHLPFVEEYNDMVQESVEDIRILFDETERLGTFLSEYFNHAQSEKLRIEQHLRGLNGMVTDLNLISNDSDIKGTYFRDSFDDMSKVEMSMAMGEHAQVSTREGILTLGRNGTVNRSEKAKVRQLEGNGIHGTKHIARNKKVVNRDGLEVTEPVYMSQQNPHDNLPSILDGSPATIFEYQMLGANREEIRKRAKGYDFSYATSAERGDTLRMKLVVELESKENINWININPYHPPLSDGKVNVYSIRTSEDGFEYLPLYDNQGAVINSEINNTPQTYRVDGVFDGSNDFTTSKFSGQGVWSFPTRPTKYVEIVLEQKESYPEKIGHTYYEKVKKWGAESSNQKAVRIRESEVPENIQKAEPGVYRFDSESDILKGIETFDGWRYAIGLRDINIMSHQFVEKSELVTSRFESTSPIEKIMLYANEKIPESYLKKMALSNDWIQYWITVDDVNWERISPMHHEPVSEEGFPPKIFEINPNTADIESTFRLHKQAIESEEPVHSVRMKIILSRPLDIDNSESTTPILEDYALRVITSNENEEGI